MCGLGGRWIDSRRRMIKRVMAALHCSGKILEVIVDDNARWCRLVLIDG